MSTTEIPTNTIELLHLTPEQSNNYIDAAGAILAGKVVNNLEEIRGALNEALNNFFSKEEIKIDGFFSESIVLSYGLDYFNKKNNGESVQLVGEIAPDRMRELIENIIKDYQK